MSLPLGLEPTFLFLWLRLTVFFSGVSCFLKPGLTHPGNRACKIWPEARSCAFSPASSTFKAADLSDNAQPNLVCLVGGSREEAQKN